MGVSEGIALRWLDPVSLKLREVALEDGGRGLNVFGGGLGPLAAHDEGGDALYALLGAKGPQEPWSEAMGWDRFTPRFPVFEGPYTGRGTSSFAFGVNREGPGFISTCPHRPRGDV